MNATPGGLLILLTFSNNSRGNVGTILDSSRRNHVVQAGLLRPGSATGLLLVIRHRCDEASCHRPSHWVTGSTADNVADFSARGQVPGSPLTDRRGAAGRAIAIRGAILAGLGRGDSRERIEAAIWSASAAGVPGGQARLLDWPAADAKETT